MRYLCVQTTNLVTTKYIQIYILNHFLGPGNLNIDISIKNSTSIFYDHNMISVHSVVWKVKEIFNNKIQVFRIQ